VSADVEREVSDRAARLRGRLVRQLRRSGDIRSDRVADAIGEVPRELFVSGIAASRGLEAVYRNEALAAKTDAQGRWLSSSSQPSMMAIMLEQLELKPGHRVLEIGAGTGYNTALLRHIVGSSGQVTTIEIDPQLARQARRALRVGGYRARVIVGDGREGFASGAPYDRIIVTASVAEIPNAWVDQLHPGGRLELPLRLGSDALPQVIPALELRAGSWQSIAMTWGGFLPLREGGERDPPPTLFAGDWADGTHRSLISITGPGLERLSAAGRRRLLALALSAPSSREDRGYLVTRWPAPPSLLVYLHQSVPAARRVELHTSHGEAVGLLSADGRGIAVASFRVRHLAKGEPCEKLGQPKRDRWFTETYGTGDAHRELDAILARWRALRTSRRTELQIEARRSDTSSNLDVELAWKQAAPALTG
jgi:protein-L-isoaspartate(D-aspartate) O-methyltransferase